MMQKEKLFEIQQRAFREWLASLEFDQLQRVARDVMVCLDYTATKIERGQTKEQFLEIMRRNYGA